MPAHRKPFELLAVTGQLRRNPKRYQDRQPSPKSTSGIGDPPASFSPELKEIWRELVSDAPRGVLQASDRAMLELACRLMHRSRFGQPKTSELAIMVNVLAKLGLSPTDRSRVSVAVEERPADEVERFLMGGKEQAS